MTLAKAEFSNSANANLQKWNAYIKKADPKRQEVLTVALDWVATAKSMSIDAYLAQNRNEESILELRTYFTTVIDWIASVFTRPPDKEMKGLQWNLLYETYHSTSYNQAEVDAAISRLRGDPFVGNRRGIYEYVLGGEVDHKLLSIRVFDDKIIALKYEQQTAKATADGVSNCPLCAIGENAKRTRIYKLAEMEADHVEAWSKGGATTIENCEMLCVLHNRNKGNR